MAKKVIISEKQLGVLAKHIQESDRHQILVKRIVDDLNLNYEPTSGTYKKGGEYYDEQMVQNKVNKEMMTPKSLFDYMQYKYELGDKFLQQIINDWFKGNMTGQTSLSKNVPVS
jgi:hypothetical protein